MRQLLIEYINLIASMCNFGTFRLYNLEQYRTDLHQQIVDVYDLDYVASKDILSHLDKYLDINFEDIDSYSNIQLEQYAIQLEAVLLEKSKV